MLVLVSMTGKSSDDLVELISVTLMVIQTTKVKLFNLFWAVFGCIFCERIY